jgi:hypothetical protein
VYVNTATVTATDDAVETNNSDEAAVRVTVSAQHPRSYKLLIELAVAAETGVYNVIVETSLCWVPHV